MKETAGDAIEDAMMRVTGVHEVLWGPDVLRSRWPEPGALVPVDGDPAELVPVWRRGDEVAYAYPSQLLPAGRWDAVMRATDELTAAAQLYAEDRITLEEFERRAEAIIKREDGGP